MLLCIWTVTFLHNICVGCFSEFLIVFIFPCVIYFLKNLIPPELSIIVSTQSSDAPVCIFMPPLLFPQALSAGTFYTSVWIETSTVYNC